MFVVTPGLRYRFRIINASAMTMYRLSFEGHSFTVIESDGVNCVPLNADYLEISAGQRYSIVVCFLLDLWMNLNETGNNVQTHPSQFLDQGNND